MSIVLVLATEKLADGSYAVTDDEIRDFVCGVFEGFAGLSADPSTVDAYDRVIAPDEIEGRHSALQNAMNGMWSCALTVDGGERYIFEYGEISPEARAKILFFWQRYVISNAMSDESRAGDAFGARKGRDQILAALKAKQRIIGRATFHIIDVAAVAHTYTQVSEPDPTTGLFRTIEGGSLDKKGYKAIAAGARALLADGRVTNAARSAFHSLDVVIDMVTEIRAAGIKVPVSRDRDTPNAGGESAPATNVGTDETA